MQALFEMCLISGSTPCPGKMCEQAFYPEILKRGNRGRRVCALLIRLQSDPPHSCIHGDMDRSDNSCFPGGFAELPGHGKLEDRRSETLRHDRFVIFRECKPEDQDRFPDACKAQPDSFLNGGYRKSPDIVIILDKMRDLFRSVPVSICLHNSNHAHAVFQVRAHGSEIMLHGAETDFRTDPGMFFHLFFSSSALFIPAICCLPGLSLRESPVLLMIDLIGKLHQAL